MVNIITSPPRFLRRCVELTVVLACRLKALMVYEETKSILPKHTCEKVTDLEEAIHRYQLLDTSEFLGIPQLYVDFLKRTACLSSDATLHTTEKPIV